MSAGQGRFGPGDLVVFIDHKGREYVRRLDPSRTIHVRDGVIHPEHLIGLREGERVYNHRGQPFLLLRPTLAQWIPNLPRQAQPIYPKDIGPILVWGDFFPGARVVEVGVGPGALSTAILRSIGPTGQLTSYEARPDFAERARLNVEMFLGAVPNWTLKVANAFDGIEERDVDRLVVDLAEPWLLVESAARALRPGGVLLSHLPTVLQVKALVDALRSEPTFGATSCFETLQRFWHVEGRSVRPEHRMVAHTGFLVVARRLAGTRQQGIASAPPARNGPAGDP